MTQGDDEVDADREQTQVKHYILRHYLERFAHIVGSTWSSITYVDGFAGPVERPFGGPRDSSFAIALRRVAGPLRFLIESIFVLSWRNSR